jgi:hypothetical protein
MRTGLAGQSCAKLQKGNKHKAKQQVNCRKKCVCIGLPFHQIIVIARYHDTLSEGMMETPST